MHANFSGISQVKTSPVTIHSISKLQLDEIFVLLVFRHSSFTIANAPDGEQGKPLSFVYSVCVKLQLNSTA